MRTSRTQVCNGPGPQGPLLRGKPLRGDVIGSFWQSFLVSCILLLVETSDFQHKLFKHARPLGDDEKILSSKLTEFFFKIAPSYALSIFPKVPTNSKVVDLDAGYNFAVESLKIYRAVFELPIFEKLRPP